VAGGVDRQGAIQGQAIDDVHLAEQARGPDYGAKDMVAVQRYAVERAAAAAKVKGAEFKSGIQSGRNQRSALDTAPIREQVAAGFVGKRKGAAGIVHLTADVNEASHLPHIANVVARECTAHLENG